MFKHSRIILASASPRRKDLLAGIGLKFDVMAANIDEESYSAATAQELVKLLSLEKARALSLKHETALVIAADTVVVLDDDVLGKPKDLAENKRFIERLAGRSHYVYTGHTLSLNGVEKSYVEETEVRFRALNDAEIERFVATGEGLDKAGGYAIQGYGSSLVPFISGDYFNVVGLSVCAVIELAKQLGVTLV